MWVFKVIEYDSIIIPVTDKSITTYMFFHVNISTFGLLKSFDLYGFSMVWTRWFWLITTKKNKLIQLIIYGSSLSRQENSSCLSVFCLPLLDCYETWNVN